MKKVILFCTKLRFFFVEIPPILLLLIAISYNDTVDTAIKLYPLIAVSVLFIIFVFLYFFRLIIISTEEIRSAGLFSSRDSAIINKGKALIITPLKKNKLRVVLFGKSGIPDFSWAKNEGYENLEIDLYREVAVGGTATLKRIFKYFGVPSDEIKSILNTDFYKKEYKYFTLTASTENGVKEYRILFTETI